MYWMFLPLRRYADFSGRSRRLEYWMFTLGNTVVMIALFAALISTRALATARTGPAVTPIALMSPMARIAGAAFILYMAAIAVPMIAVQVRRLHDQGRSGWALLLTFLPHIGTPILLLFMLRGGVRGPNRFGEDPTDPYAAATPGGGERPPRRPQLG